MPDFNWQGSSEVALRRYWAFYLIAATPLIFALVTWGYDWSDPDWVKFARRYSIPVVISELLVVWYAIGRNACPSRLLQAQSNWVKVALAGLIAVSLYTALFVATYKWVALFRTSFWYVHCVFGLSVAALAGRGLGLSTSSIWWAVTVGLVGYSLAVVWFIFDMPYHVNFDWVYFYLGVTNIRQTGFYTIVGYCSAIAIAATEQSKQRYGIILLCATVMATLTFWSGTRSAIFAIAVSLGVGAIFLKLLRTKRALIAILVSTLGGLFLSVVLSAPDPSLGILRAISDSARSGAEEISSGRISIWEGTLAKISERPWFGFGESQFRQLVPEARRLYNHPHNSFLQIVFQWGVVGAILFFSLVGMAWLNLLKKATGAPEQHVHAFLVVTGLLAMSMVEGSLYHPYPVMMIAFSFAISHSGRPAYPTAV